MRGKFFAPFLKKIIYLESGQLTYTENNNFLKFLRREYSVRSPGLKDQPGRKKVAYFLLIFGKFIKNGAFFVFTTCSESL